jgi:hypothetical protein
MDFRVFQIYRSPLARPLHESGLTLPTHLLIPPVPHV